MHLTDAGHDVLRGALPTAEDRQEAGAAAEPALEAREEAGREAQDALTAVASTGIRDSSLSSSPAHR